jgi:carbon-monoxide dehydrogenase small subunit
MATKQHLRLMVNGIYYERDVEPRESLADFLRDDLGLTGTHIGCEHGICGACTLLMNGVSVRSCILYAIQADGHELTTIEGLTEPGNPLHPVQEAFSMHHGLQCGFCTPGFLMVVMEFLTSTRSPTEEEIREALSGNLCRCTGYQSIIDAVKAADLAWQR